MSDPVKERLLEGLHYAAGDMPVDVIRSVRVGFDNAEDFVAEFENGERAYALYVVLMDKSSLGWKECQAVADIMRICARGTKINNETYLSLFGTLKQKYGRIGGPSVQSNRLVGGVFPGTGTFQRNNSDVIVGTSISLDKDGDLVFEAKTECGQKYRIILERTGGKGSSLLDLDCQAFIEILCILETGDVVTKRQFWAFGYVLRNKYNRVKASTTLDGTMILAVLATRVPNADPIDTVLLQAFQAEAASQGGGATSEPSIASSSGDDLSYTGIRLTRLIRGGGQAKVYAAVRQGKAVALKVFGDDDATATEAYKTELRMLLKMSKHTNVVEVFDFFERPRPALAMQLIEGDNLGEYISRNGPMGVVEGRKMAVGIASGLCHLHRHGVIHRDLKSFNIMRRNDGTPVIIDLGLSSVLGRQQPSSGPSRQIDVNDVSTLLTSMHISDHTSQVRGTIQWLAPEMITEQVWSDRTDVYAFGIILWEMFSGKTPFAPEDGSPVAPLKILMDIATGKRPNMNAVEHIDKDLKELMEKCWSMDPKERPSMRRVLDLLSQNDPVMIFRSIDKDNDGSLDFGEFVNFLQKYARGQIKVEQMHVIFNAIDSDKSGDIELSEFLTFWGLVELHGLPAAVKLACRKHKDGL